MSVVTLTVNPAIDLSAEVETVTPTHKLRAESVRRDPGGGGINVARVIARLGGAARAIYPTGGGIGQVLRRLVEAEGVASDTFEIAGDTRESFTVRERKSGREYRFVLPGPAMSAAKRRVCLEHVAALTDETAFLVMSGSLAVGMPDTFYAEAAKTAKARSIPVALDTSGPPLDAALRQGVFLIKPNLRELQQLVGRKLADRDAWLAAARGLVREGQAEIVALTLGHRGGLVATREEALFAPPLPVEPASAVGAGDSFLAGMVWGLAQGCALADAFAYGMAAGSAALLTPGTGLCDADDVRRLYPQVRLERL